MKILNTEKEDYHVHSINYSDGLNTIDEMVRFAGEIGMKKIVFTDHSQKGNEKEGKSLTCFRSAAQRWKNVHNDIEIVFGVEADLLNEKGDICDDIQGIKGDFIILSYHPEIYQGAKKKLTQAFINAIERHHKIINAIGHLHAFSEDIDILVVVEHANKYDIPLEFNCRYLNPKWGDVKRAKLMLSKAKSIYVNSDAHTLVELRDGRKKGFDFLRENGYI
ncbi:PHP domain-containing protein [Candidatus Woesearchaeota archaeon]|nr:PHP domain-containing protein [Candidatus Woesearchaeota archaeon]